MSLSEADCRQLAAAARIHLSPAASAALAADLNDMMQICAELPAIETGATVPLTYPGEGEPGLLRPDRAEAGLTTAEALLNAPDAGDGHFRVPPMIAHIGPGGGESS